MKKNSTIPFLDLKSTYVELKDELDIAFKRVMNSGYYILGEEVELFEKEYATFVDSNNSIVFDNGIQAIRLAQIACGSEPVDEVWYLLILTLLHGWE